MRKKENNKNVIEIEEEVSIPQEDGTNVILEKGDKVEILKEEIVPNYIADDIVTLMKSLDKFIEDPSDYFEAGQELGSIILSFSKEDLVYGLYDYLEEFVR